MEQWEMDLREEIREAFAKSNTPMPPQKPKRKTQIRSFLFLVAVLLLLMNFVVLEVKHPGYLATKFNQVTQMFDRDQTIVEQPSEDPLIVVLKGLNARIAALEEKDYTDEEARQELKALREKVLLIAIVADENAAISKKILSRYDVEGRQFIHIDKDWKIDRMPTHIKIDSTTEDFLRERMR